MIFIKDEKRKKKLLLGRSKVKNHFSLTLAPTTLKKIFLSIDSENFPQVRQLRTNTTDILTILNLVVPIRNVSKWTLLDGEKNNFLVIKQCAP